MDKKKKSSILQYAVFTIAAIVLYLTGLHAEVIGFAQRGLLATGLMNPDLKEIVEVHNRMDDSAANVDKADLDLLLRDADGNITSLQELKGKPIFINFWATWCPPCVAEMPSIDKLHQKMGDKVHFVMLSFDEDFKRAIAFKERKDYDFNIYQTAGPIPQTYDSNALPTTYVIDAEGNLALTHMGMADYGTLEFIAFLEGLTKGNIGQIK